MCTVLQRTFHFLRGTTIRIYFTSFLIVVIVLLLLSACSKAPSSNDGVAVVNEARTGEVIYKKYCANCHQGSIPRSPVLGKQADWTDRVEKGRAALIENVRVGIPPEMPKMGSCRNCTDEELGNAVDYMLAALEEEETEEETE
ncbi:MAG: cytochrome c5 family protein [Gammaproteobacteria bacterium]|nr:cytochrome c5 family protein [Gammaproteobacteria bacterium]MYI77311.1 cytochrome c5 family protein [Gammaproteobacteria bacterium]